MPNPDSFDDQSISASFWEQRYQDCSDYLYGVQPNAYLTSKAAHFRPGMSALAVADGDGRNGVWLAEQGLDVLSVDRSKSAQRKAARLARDRRVHMRIECVDLATWDWPKDRLDLVVSIFAHFGPRLRTVVHQLISDALHPGGVVVLQGFNRNQHKYESGGPEDAEFLIDAEAMSKDFEGLLIEELIEYVDELDEGEDHRGPAALLGLVARKPGRIST